MSLNQGQQQAAEAFLQFLLDPDASEYILSGPAGVGKTFWLDHVCTDLFFKYKEISKALGLDAPYTGIELTATTNKAAAELQRATGWPTSTIHSFLRLRIQENYRTGTVDLKRARDWMVHQHKIIIIDEAFTMDSVLRKHLKESTYKCKIVYVGDHAQLGPVKEKECPLLRLQNTPFFELTEPMRTNIGDLQKLNQQLRNTVLGAPFMPIKVVPGIIDWISDDGQMIQEIKQAFSSNDINARVLAYTNDQVNAFNDFIRESRGHKDMYEVGDVLICNTAIQLGKQFISAEEEVEIIQLHPEEFVGVFGEHDEVPVQMAVQRAKLYVHGEELWTMLPTNRDHYAALVKHYGRVKDWTTYFSLKNTHPDLRPRDCLTIHKAQGSSYDTVYLDCENLSTCHQPAVVARLLYVAISRAKTRVVLYGNLAQKYGGIIQ